MTGLDESTARKATGATTAGSSWSANTPTDNPDDDGIVLSQTPDGRRAARSRSSTVTLTVGRLRQQTDTTETTTTTPTPPTTPLQAQRRARRGRSRAGAPASTRSRSPRRGPSLDGLDPDRYDVQTIEIDRDGRWELDSGEVGRLERPVAETLPVPTGHRRRRWATSTSSFRSSTGRSARTGRCRACWSSRGVPYVGAGVTASALCMDKDLFKSVCRDKGIPVTRNVTLRERRRAGREPVRLPGLRQAGAARLVGRASRRSRTEDELEAAVALARRHDEKVLVEEFVDGVEVEGRRAREPPADRVDPGEIVSHGFDGADWYDYSAKYDEGGMDLDHPAARPAGGDRARAGADASTRFIATDCEGMARVDCFVRRTARCW